MQICNKLQGDTTIILNLKCLMNIKVKTTYQFVKLENLSPFHILPVLIVNTRWRTLEVNDWNEK